MPALAPSSRDFRIGLGAAGRRLTWATDPRAVDPVRVVWGGTQEVLFDRAKPRSVNGKTRNRTVHRSPLAVEVLAALSHESGDPCVVPGAKSGTHMADIDWA